jgi:1-acyl-sn-glycerol-3-phosphate acyltransferase
LILKAKHNFFVYGFFKLYSNFKTRVRFKPVNVVSDFVSKDMPVLLIANHVSWWDGFWALYLTQIIFRRKFHFMMLESQLRKFWLFNYSGGYSVDKNSRNLIETIRYTCELLRHKENLVLIFAQGKIHSMHQQDFVFEKGAEFILKKLENPVQVVFLASLVDYFSNQKPSLTFYLTEYSGADFTTGALQQSYRSFYMSCIENQEKLAK